MGSSLYITIKKKKTLKLWHFDDRATEEGRFNIHKQNIKQVSLLLQVFGSLSISLTFHNNCGIIDDDFKDFYFIFYPFFKKINA